ncbi:hypothetical protein CRYUN_Cryun22dG0076600 [Craigia yunnanensis]
MVETMALKDGIVLAVENNWHNVVLEIDSKYLHGIISSDSKLMDWKIRPLVLDIKEKLKLIPNWKLSLVRKSANAAIDWVAVQTKKGICMSNWLRQVSFSLVGILNKDGLSAPLFVED